jgi:hypothetical protein
MYTPPDKDLPIIIDENILPPPHNISDEEALILQQRGFLVKNMISFWDTILSLPLFLILHLASMIAMTLPMALLLELLDGPMVIYVLVNQSIFLYWISRLFISFVYQWKSFWYIDKLWKVATTDKPRWQKYLHLYYDWISLYREQGGEKRQTEVGVSRIWYAIFSIISIWLVIGTISLFSENIETFNFHPYNDYLYPLITVFCGFYIVGYIARQLVEHFHPLYIFDNLGEKIQKLTPTIEEQSKNIQSEFESNMDFSVLSHGFELLSRNFSEIVQLIIKLEKAEKRANQWNLFDSEKYINSLRSDIVTPLISLKAFLEEKKTELIQSKQELTRVQVWWTEESGNVELQAKRSDSLIQELADNIEKLDVMIGKMG